MKNILSSFARSKVFTLVLVAIFALPMLAHAEGYKGKFTLTAETHWGSAVLAPGDYDFMLDSASAPTRVVVRSANGDVVAILVSMWTSETSAVKTNSLQLEARGSDTFVSAVYLTDMGTEVHFAVPTIKTGTIAKETAKTPATTMAASVQ
jgi:hypothetical protein